MYSYFPLFVDGVEVNSPCQGNTIICWWLWDIYIYIYIGIACIAYIQPENKHLRAHFDMWPGPSCWCIVINILDISLFLNILNRCASYPKQSAVTACLYKNNTSRIESLHQSKPKCWLSLSCLLLPVNCRFPGVLLTVTFAVLCFWYSGSL